MTETHEPEDLRKLYIGKLSYKSTEESLKAYFGQWGEVVDCVIMKDRVSKQSRGFGFITFKRAYMVDEAQGARPHKIDGREVESRRASPKEDSGKPESQIKVNKLYVEGVKDDLTEEDLREHFGPYGNIKKVNFAVDKASGKRKGIAFVEFDDYDPVDKIVLQKHNYKGRNLIVKKGFSKEEINSIKMKRGMGGFGRGSAVNGRGRGEWQTADEYYGGGYGAYDYDASMVPSSDYAPWGINYGNSYGGGLFRGSSGYSQRSRGPYKSGRNMSSAYEWR